MSGAPVPSCRAPSLSAAALILTLGPLTCARAETVPSKSVADSRIRTLLYSGDEVYRLRGYVGYQIDLEFEAGETFVGLSAGDLEGLSFNGQDNHLFVKPKAPQVATNLTVLTTRRHYYFDYAAVARRPSADDPNVIYTVRFSYPSSHPQSTQEAAAKRIDQAFEAGVPERTKNLDYWYCGTPELQPVAVSDDGVHTLMRFPVHAELPVIFVRGEDGGESLLNFSVDGDGDVVVHRVARQFVLRRGASSGCILNRGFQGTGARLQSGTVSSEVERRVQRRSP
jgi:type IV secretion system protein VirB9